MKPYRLPFQVHSSTLSAYHLNDVLNAIAAPQRIETTPRVSDNSLKIMAVFLLIRFDVLEKDLGADGIEDNWLFEK